MTGRRRLVHAACLALVVLGAAGLAAYWVAVLTLEPFRPQHLAWGLVLLTPLYGVGVLAYARRPDLPIARLLLLAGSAWAAYSGVVHLGLGVTASRPWTAVAATALGGVAVAAAVTLFALYPDGRWHRAYEKWLVRGVWAVTLAAVLARLLAAPALRVDVEHTAIDVPNPLAVPGLEALQRPVDLAESALGVLVLAVPVLLVIRYRRAGQQARRQLRWLLLVPLCALGLALLGLLLQWSGVDTAWFIAGTVGQYVYLGLIPAVLLISILRHRLLDVDMIIRKSLVYGVLVGLIGAGYVAAAATIGILANVAVGPAGAAQLPVALAVLLAVAATLLFQPARRALERVADRWVFGQRLRGHALLEHLGSQLEQTVDQTELTTRLADAVCAGLRLRWAEVVLHGRPPGGATVAQSHAGAPRRHVEVPVHRTLLTYAGEALGAIECGPKRDGAFGAEDEQVLATLSRQAALAVRNARLTSELAARVRDVEQQAAELAASRARIVAAEDAERRRIERDLHDGVQQQVVALLAKLALARNQAQRRPERAAATLSELESEIATLHSDLIELTRGIHPPVLTDRGLVEALRSRAEKLPLQVDVRVSGLAREQRFPDEIEGAAYFVCSEALTNVLKHARATRAVVRLGTQQDRLNLEVIDDGVGFSGAVRGSGHGLANIADRLDALGGRLRVDSSPGAGTAIFAELPVGGR